MKCRKFVSGLHILTNNRIPESILHADVFSKILHGVFQYLHMDNVYSLLYGSSVNPYHINYVLYMTLSLPLKHNRGHIMSLYGITHTTCQRTCQILRLLLQNILDFKSDIHIFY